MLDALPLFDLAKRAPTTRDVADAVRAGGAAALTEAVRRADAARYQEVRCRSALNRVAGMPFQWTLNPYRGCTHGCHYCYARRYHTQFALGSGDEFTSIILVKTNFAEVLRRELGRPTWTREYVAVGTATDGYQPIEGHYRITRASLEALCEARTPVGVVTKGPLVVRDTDVLQAIGRATTCTVAISVPTVDEDAWAKLEPGTAPPAQRLRAVRALVDAGVRAGVLMHPIVPGLTSRRSILERTVKAVADSGATFVSACALFLEGGAREHFMRWLADAYPDLRERYEHLYAGKHAPAAYRSELRHVVGLLQAKYGLSHAPRERGGRDEREERADDEDAPEGRTGTSRLAAARTRTEPAQQPFRWSDPDS
jgi:DNA repair photolyase